MPLQLAAQRRRRDATAVVNWTYTASVAAVEAITPAAMSGLMAMFTFFSPWPRLLAAISARRAAWKSRASFGHLRSRADRPLLSRVVQVAFCIVAVCGLFVSASETRAQDLQEPDPALLEHGLEITPPGRPTEYLDLSEALRTLHIPSVSIALIDHGILAWARAYGAGASIHTLYQAASLSKFVTAVAVLSLAQQGRLDLDRNVNEVLISWKLPDSLLARSHPVTLRGLLSMTGGIGVPGYLGYAPAERLPSLVEILDGIPPANSAPVRIEYVPGTQYHYSGGGYEIIQAIVQDTTRQPFAAAMDALVLRPADMKESAFGQPLPAPSPLWPQPDTAPTAGNCRPAGAWCRNWRRAGCGPRPLISRSS
jgi:CubicO group peptidase (beta-lactamase class C family)